MLAVLFPNISHMYMSQQLLIEAELVLLWSDIQVLVHNFSLTSSTVHTIIFPIEHGYVSKSEHLNKIFLPLL